MTTKLKLILTSIGITAILVAGAFYYAHEPPLPPFGGELPEQAADIAKLKTTIKTDRQDNGKYKRRDKEIINGIEYEVHEYETSKGELGYQIFVKEITDTEIITKAIGYGVNADNLTWTRKEKLPITTTTSTK